MNLVEFSYRSQIYYLRKVALQALSLYQIPYEQVKLVVHGENTTFKVISKNRKYALRIHRLDYHCYEGIAAELEWLKELKSCSYLQVPVPIQSHDGKYIQTVRIQELKNPRYVILFPWLPGRFCEKSLNTKKMKQVGISTAKLQLSGKKIPLSIAQNRLHWNYEGLLGKNAITSRDYLKHTTKQQAMIIQKFADQIKKQLQCLQTDSNHFGLIHADLHRGNFLFHKDNIAIIDFDDSGLGYYMYDLAVTMASMKNLEKEMLSTMRYWKAITK